MSEDTKFIKIGQILDRSVMPQVENPDDFRNYLKNNKIMSKKRLVDGSDLRSSQLNFDNEKIEAMMTNPTNKMMVVSNDGHVMDGHHRWIANQQMGRKCLVLQAELPILELIKTANDYNNQLNEEAGLHDHGEMNHEKFGPMLDTFVQFASKKLGIKSLPSMKLEKEPMETSFGGYNPSEKSIVVISKNRHPMDIYRTVAHELVHHKQNEDGRLGKDIAKEGSTGSPIENEANAEAGKIMRWFAKSNPSMFKSGYVTESYLKEALQDPAKMKAIFLAGGPGSGKDFVMKKTLAGHGLTEINSDNALEHLMKMRGLDPMMPKEEDYERNIARGAAKRITKEKERLALAGRRGVIINGTADDSEKISGIKGQLEGLGYETKMLFVNTSDEVSRQRNFERGLGGGRKVPDGTDKTGRPDGSPDIRSEKWQGAQEAKEPLKKIFGDEHFIEVDNSDDYRTVDAKRKKQIDRLHSDIFKHYRQFVSTPAATPQAASWIKTEKKKRKIRKYAPARATSVSQRAAKKYEPNASELEQAKVLGVSHIGGGQFGKSKDEPTHVSRNGQLVMLEEKGSLSLKNWFDKSKSKDGKKGWVQVGGRYDGEPCARQPGQTSTPKCRSSSERASMSKKEREYAFKKKQREDPDQPQKSGAARPTMVKTYKHQKESYEMDKKTLQEKKDACYHKVKSRYKVWPSAYASGALVKCRKAGADNWGNKSKVDENFEEYISKSSNREEGTNSVAKIYKKVTPGQKTVKKKLAQEDNTIPRGGIGNPGSPGVGPETTVFRPMVASGYGGAGTIPMYESVEEWANNPIVQNRFIAKYGDQAAAKLTEAAERLSELELGSHGPKFFTHLREAWSYGKDPNDRMGTLANQGKEEIGEEDEDVIKPSKSLKGYKKHIHPMSRFEKKSLGEQRTHTVSKGQTASGIASQYGMSLRQFRELNPSVRDINTIGVGQKFNVGAAPSTTAPTTTRAPSGSTSLDFKAPSTPRQMPTGTGGDTGSKKVTDFGAQAFRGVGDTARGVIDRRLFNRTSDKEYDKLIKATHAETSPKGSSRESSGEHAGIALSIANRAAREGGGEGSISRVLNAPNQFQAVTGTKRNRGGSPEFRRGPSAERKKDIEDAIVRQGSSIPSNQVNFTAADPKAYKAGTDISWRTKLMKTGEVVGGSVFGTRRKADAEPGKVANWTDPSSIPKSEPKKAESPTIVKMDDKTLGFRPSQGFRSSTTTQRPETPNTSGTVTADPNKDMGDQIRKWMQPQVDRMIRSRQTPSTRATTPSSGGALSPEPMKKSQGPDQTLGSQRTLRAPEPPKPKVDNSAQQDDDAERVRQETGRAAASAIRNADPVVSKMDPNSEMRKALTEPKGKANVFTGSRYGDQGIDEEAPAWQRKEGKNPEGGLNKKGVASYRAANPGSKLQTAVTTEPSKLKKGSKSAKRRLSFCRRMKGMKKKLTSAETARDPDSRINKSLRKWNCEE